MTSVFQWNHTIQIADIFSVVALAVFFLSCCCLMTCKLRRVSRNACVMVEVILFVCGGSVWTLRQSIIKELANTASVASNITSIVESVSKNNVLATW